MSAGVQWTIRRSFWDFLTAVKYRAATPARIPVPAPLGQPLESVPLREVFPAIAIDKIQCAKNVPADEASPRKRRA